MDRKAFINGACVGGISLLMVSANVGPHNSWQWWAVIATMLLLIVNLTQD